MKYYCYTLLMLAIEAYSAEAQPAILNFTQSSVAVGPHGKMTFYCETVGGYTFWKINNMIYLNDTSHPSYDMVHSSRSVRDGSGSQAKYYLFLVIRATTDNNGTEITCNVNHVPLVMQEKIFIIASPPSKPIPHLEYNAEEVSLTVTWNESFTYSGFDVNYYTLQIINTNLSSMNMSLHRVFTDRFNELPTICNEIEYIVTAYNDIGNTSGAVRGGFPISVAQVDVQWKVLYQQNGDPHLEIWFKPSNSCSYQTVSYHVLLVDTTGESLPLNSSDFLYTVHSGLTSNANYTIVVEASSIAGITQTRQPIFILEQLFCSPTQVISNNECYCNTTHVQIDTGGHDQQKSILTATTGVLAGSIAILLVLIMIFTCLLCRNKRLLMKHKAVRAFTETVVSSDVGAQRPTSLQTSKCAASNPIYEGPLYESPNGEPLRALLGSTPSTPNTPLDSPRYIFDAFPPSLPPPRKLSLVSNSSLSHNSPDASPTATEAVNNMESTSSEARTLKTEGDEYTVMRPAASVHPRRVSKPSPLVLPTQLSALPEV